MSILCKPYDENIIRLHSEITLKLFTKELCMRVCARWILCLNTRALTTSNSQMSSYMALRRRPNLLIYQISHFVIFGYSPDSTDFFERSNLTKNLKSNKVLRGTSINLQKNHSLRCTENEWRDGTGAYYSNDVILRRNNVSFLLNQKSKFKEF